MDSFLGELDVVIETEVKLFLMRVSAAQAASYSRSYCLGWIRLVAHISLIVFVFVDSWKRGAEVSEKSFVNIPLHSPP